MKKIVLLRHGESQWNKENRFTGWTDVDLSEKGVAEAEKAGDALRDAGFAFGMAYTSKDWSQDNDGCTHLADILVWSFLRYITSRINLDNMSFLIKVHLGIQTSNHLIHGENI